MNAAEKMTSISIDDYLVGELSSDVRHEFVDGLVYAMVGGTGNHSRLAVRIASVLDRQLADSNCSPFSSDFKVRIQQKSRTFFYHPDVSVFCGSDRGNDVFGSDPVVIIEVLSDSTRRTDQGEKRDNYMVIPTLQTYILMEQDEVKSVVYQRTASAGFEAAVYYGDDAKIPLVAVGAELDLGQIYRGIVTA